MRTRAAGLLLALLMAVSARGGELLVIHGGTLVDTADPSASGPATLLVRDGLVEAVIPAGAKAPAYPEGTRYLDASGQFILPGLADMHLHLRTGTWLLDGDPLPIARGLLGWGITTVLDPASPPAWYARLGQAMEEAPGQYPRVLLARGLFTAPGGWGMPGGYAPETPEQARAQVRAVAAAGTDAIKIIHDDMRWITRRPFTAMKPEILYALVDEAHRHGLLVLVHAPLLEFAREAVAAGADVLMHGIISEPVDDEFIALMQASGTSYVSTLALFHTTVQLADVAERLLRLDPTGTLDRYLAEAFGLPALGGGRFTSPAWSADRLPVVSENLRRLHAAGINIVIGTDAGTPGLLPGSSLHLELGLHREAGLDTGAILAAVTVNAARMLSGEPQFGALRPGLAADLVILEADPRLSLGALRQVAHVVRAGRLQLPHSAAEARVP
ncbi:MAG: amidohydrolase family protein [Chromatiales bacterium]|nr:amidohydrolase family protein [Chromatiales bacterium]